jgi:hypothetical protein
MAEIVTCPACARKLQVPEDYFGKTVQCPECKETFLAQAIPVAAVTANAVPSAVGAPAWEKPAAPRADEDPRADQDEDDETDPDDDRPRRRQLAPHRGGMILAFGIVAIIGIAWLWVVMGPLAWFMGQADLNEMRAGRMDPSGESMTNTGRILGMAAIFVHTGLVLLVCLVIGLFYCGMFSLIAAVPHK